MLSRPRCCTIPNIHNKNFQSRLLSPFPLSSSYPLPEVTHLQDFTFKLIGELEDDIQKKIHQSKSPRRHSPFSVASQQSPRSKSRTGLSYHLFLSPLFLNSNSLSKQVFQLLGPSTGTIGLPEVRPTAGEGVVVIVGAKQHCTAQDVMSLCVFLKMGKNCQTVLGNGIHDSTNKTVF